MPETLQEILFKEIDKELGNKLFDYTRQEIGVLKTQLRDKINARLDREKCTVCLSSQGKANSHNIPISVLRNISSNGYLSSSAEHIIDNNKKIFIFPSRTGIGSTQTFNIICSVCENTLFIDYENDAIENSVPYNNNQYNQLELKILLYMTFYKKYIYQFHSIANENISSQIDFVVKSAFLSDEVKMINLRYLGYQKIKSNTEVYKLDKDIIDLEKLIKINRKSRPIYNAVLDIKIGKKTSFAISQGIIPTYSDKGKQVNKTTDFSLFNYNFGYLYIAVLPFNDTGTRVCVFYHNKYENNIGFIKKEFDSLSSLEEKLKKLSDLILLYSDKIVINEEKNTAYKQIYENHPKLKQLDPTAIRDPKEYLSIIQEIREINIFDI